VTHHMSSLRRRVPTVLAMMLVAALTAGVVGCGSDDDESTASGRAETNATTDSVREAQATVEKFSTLPESINYTEKLSEPVAGKNIYLAKPGVPVGEELAKGATAAAKALGLNLHIVNTGVTPASTKAAFQQIVNAKPTPDGVFLSGQEPALWSTELEQLDAMGVPVIASAVAGYKGFSAIKGRGIKVEDWQAGGRLAANYVHAQNKGEGKVVFFDLANYPVLNEGVGRGFADEYKRLCPTCPFERVAVQASTIGTTLPAAVVSYVQKNPDTKWIMTGIGDMLIGVPPALKAAGLADKVSAVSYSATAPNYKYVQDGDVQKAIIGYANLEGTWAMVHELSEAMVGQEPEQPEQPLQVITKDNMDFDVAEGWPGAVDYQQQFKALWPGVDK
jgi:ABC-type sugar transport system substrate-binding protein